MTDYEMYRGRCKEFCDQAVMEDPSLTLVRGHYYCPIWNTDEQHWWTVRQDGTIFDPTKNQFPSKGLGVYTPFDVIALSHAVTGLELGYIKVRVGAVLETHWIWD